MKYIDAEKLIAEIERRLKIVEPHKDTFESAAACRQELIWMKEFIASLQQEQPEVDLEKAFESYLNNMIGQPRMWHPNEQIEWGKSIAHHFAEWGAIHLNARKDR